MRTWMRWLACVLAVGVLAGCGGGEDKTKAHVRLVNATSGYSSLSLVIGDETVATGVAYGGSADYTDIKGQTDSADLTRPGSATLLSTSTVTVDKDTHYTMLAYGKAGSLATTLLTDEESTPSSGKALVRVINTASDAGSLDVYLTSSGDTLSEASALTSAVSYGTLGDFITVNSGTWRLRVTAAGSKTDLRLDLTGLVVPSEGVTTLVITPGSGGVLVNALLLVQQGSIAQATNPQARVRVVGGTVGGSVTASVAGTALISGDTAPVLSSYALVTAGSATVAVDVSGATAALTSATLDGGGDYTLLVYGTADAPQAVLLTDDNTLPGSSSQAKVRLVHALADSTDTASLKLNFSSIASGVAQGAASAYADVDAITAAEFDASVGSTALTAVTDKDVVAQGVYTFFITGAVDSPTQIFFKDR